MIDTHSIDDTDYNRKLHKNFIKFPANPAYEWSFLQSAGFLQPIDEQLKRKISELVAEGVRSVPEMSRHLSYYVKSELFRDRVIPEKDNRRFHPTKRAIRSHMYSATIKQQLSFIDQDNAASLVEKWAVEKPGDHFFFRPHSLSDEEQDAIRDPADVIEDDNDVSVTYDSKTTTLLFVHQTKEQRHLLERYGNNLCMLDLQDDKIRLATVLRCSQNKRGLSTSCLLCYTRREHCLNTRSIRGSEVVELKMAARGVLYRLLRTGNKSYRKPFPK